MAKNRNYDSLSNRQFVLKLGKYVEQWFTLIAGTDEDADCIWQNCVEKVTNEAGSMAAAKGIDLKQLTLDQFYGFAATELFATGVLSEILELPKNEYEFENLYDWQEMSLHCILRPLYREVYSRIKQK